MRDDSGGRLLLLPSAPQRFRCPSNLRRFDVLGSQVREAQLSERRHDVRFNMIAVGMQRRARDGVGNRVEPLLEVLLYGLPIVCRRDALAQLLGLSREPFRRLLCACESRISLGVRAVRRVAAADHKRRSTLTFCAACRPCRCSSYEQSAPSCAKTPILPQSPGPNKNAIGGTSDDSPKCRGDESRHVARSWLGADYFGMVGPH